MSKNGPEQSTPAPKTLDRRSLLAGMVVGGAVALDWGAIGTMAFFEEYLLPKKFAEAEKLLGELRTKLQDNSEKIAEMSAKHLATENELADLRTRNKVLEEKIEEHARALQKAREAIAK